MSIFDILSNASMTFAEFPDFESPIISPRTEGTICHDTPNLSLSQPQGCCSPPSESCSHNRSISSCVSQLTKREVPCANVKYGPPSMAMNRAPSRSYVTSTTCPFAIGPPPSPLAHPRTLTLLTIEPTPSPP